MTPAAPQSNPNAWQTEQIASHVYKSSSSTKARILPTLDAKWRVELRLSSFDNPPGQQIFDKSEDAKAYCEVELKNRKHDGEV